MARTTEEIFEDAQSDVCDVVSIAADLVAELRNAESCECPSDFCGSIESAMQKLTGVRSELAKIVKACKKIAPPE